MSANELQPDHDEILQAEPVNEPAVKVKVEGPVRTQRLPAKGGSTFTTNIANGVPKQILRADPRRRKATITSPTSLSVAFTEHGASQDSTGYTLPVNTPLIIEAVTDVFVRSTADNVVSVITELWAMGDGDA